MTDPAPVRVGVLASGRGSNLQALLDAREDGTLAPAEVACVVSDRADAAALGRARSAGLPAIFVDPGSRRARLRPEVEGEIARSLLDHGVRWVVLAGFFRIVGPTLLRSFPQRILNIHPSLLPAFPGLDAQRQAWEHGVAVTGCTVHLVDEGVDSGPILAQRAVEVRPEDDVEILAARILEQEHALLVSTVRRIASEGFELRGRRVHWKREGTGAAE